MGEGPGERLLSRVCCRSWHRADLRASAYGCAGCTLHFSRDRSLAETQRHGRGLELCVVMVQLGEAGQGETEHSYGLC